MRLVIQDKAYTILTSWYAFDNYKMMQDELDLSVGGSSSFSNA
jgi:hypothetical protein